MVGASTPPDTSVYMSKFTISTEIAAPPETVFDVLCDFAHATENIGAITKLEIVNDKPVGLGMRFRETRTMFGREATEEMEIMAFDPPHCYRVEADSCGAKYCATYKLSPNGDGTRLDVEFACTATSFFAKLMTPLSQLMLGPMKKCIAADLADIKRVAERRVSRLA
jgi:carbon monoxide dehydrogenase subunit G